MTSDDSSPSACRAKDGGELRPLSGCEDEEVEEDEDVLAVRDDEADDETSGLGREEVLGMPQRQYRRLRRRFIGAGE